jgi:hypothetical protein
MGVCKRGFAVLSSCSLAALFPQRVCSLFSCVGFDTDNHKRQAREPLGVDEATRAAIEGRVTQAGGVSPNAFDRARHLTITALRHHFFPGFCRSDLFAKLLTGSRTCACVCVCVRAMLGVY